MAEEEPRFAPKCIWCSAEWSDGNISLETWTSGNCPTCGIEAGAKIEIKCHECGKIMYEKETSSW